MSYNILADCYTESILDNEYEYCNYEYLKFDYRRPLLIHEILSKFKYFIFLILKLKKKIKITIVILSFCRNAILNLF